MTNACDTVFLILSLKSIFLDSALNQFKSSRVGINKFYVRIEKSKNFLFPMVGKTNLLSNLFHVSGDLNQYHHNQVPMN